MLAGRALFRSAPPHPNPTTSHEYMGTLGGRGSKRATHASPLLHLVCLIPKITHLHPSHAEEIDEGAEGAVAEAVLRGAGEAVGMFDGSFEDGVAAHFHQGGEEAVGA